jgi:hypothetical protein
LVWTKSRSNLSNQALVDSVRGGNKVLFSDITDSEYTGTWIDSFNSDGYVVGDTGSAFNLNGYTYVAWNWKANGAGVTNTAGTITSTVSANTTSGFSVVTYTGTGVAGATVGHGIGAAPRMMIIKSRSATAAWVVYHASLGPTQGIYLNLTDAAFTGSTFWNNVAPSSSVFTLGTVSENNVNGTTYVAYAFSEVPGYSKFGSYTGNGSTDGVFVFTGMRPAYVMIKSSSIANDWVVFDDARNTSNAATQGLYPNLNIAEQSFSGIDLLSNGFKLRNSTQLANQSGTTYIFMALAEAPQKFALAR